MTPKTFAILGAGRLGRSLGKLLIARGQKARGITCRTLRSARQAVRVIGGGEAMTSNPRAAAGAALILIATPDRAIASVARELALSRMPWRGRLLVHTSGALSSAVLEPLARRGARTASLHPLASVADARIGFERMENVPFAIEGHPLAVRELKKLILELGGAPVAIPADAKALYHLVACLMSNDLVALLAYGLEAASRLGLSQREAARLYLPLVRGTLDNVEQLGPVRALTGPVSRGDISTLRLHSEALRTLPAGFRKLHRLLALHATSLALRARTISPAVAARMGRLLGSLP